jgi:serine/threonine protein kinase
MTGVTSFFAHEQNAIDEIKRHFSSKQSYRVLSNLLIHDPQSNYYYEYDLVIVAPTNIYVVELKHWSGRIEIDSYSWRVNERNYRRDPHTSNIYKCKVLRGLYQHSFPTYPGVWVESVVVLTHPDATVEGADSPRDAADSNKRNPSFASISDFVSYVGRKGGKDQNKILREYQVDAIAAHLSRLTQTENKAPAEILGYEVVESLSATPGRIELLGRDAQGHIKGLKRFRIFRVPTAFTEKERELFLRRTYNAINSVSKIGDHPNILPVNVVKDEAIGIVEVSDWSDTGTLRDYLHNEKPDKETALSICQGLLSALCRAHEVDVIHRAVKPENVLLVNDRPRLMNFDLAYIMEDNRLTVIEDPNSLIDDGYTAPEILLGEDIDESTDYFGLAIIAYELFTGERPFRTVSEYVAKGGRLSKESRKKLVTADLPDKLVEAISDMLIGHREDRMNDLGAILAAFECRVSKVEEVGSVDEILAPGSTHDVYEIEELVAEGAEAHVYKGKTIDSRPVALKIYKRDVPRERSLQELKVTSSINSSYVIRSEYFGHWRNERYFLVMDYVAGESMRSLIEEGKTPSLDDFRSVSLCLMEAVAAFHNFKDENGNDSTLLHCDIKPDNVIITNDNKPILVDCTLAGEPRVETFQGTRGYVPPDSILGSDIQLSESSDLYALGVTLWEWLFGQKPYHRASVGDEPELPIGFRDLPEDMREWLLKAVATEARNRFSDINEMRTEFTVGKKEIEARIGQPMPVAIVEPHPDSVTQDLYVEYLNTLANNSAGNENATAEHQVLNSYFQKIHVSNPITDTIYGKLINEHRNVILTGNAGDGKTTIAIDIFKALTGEQRFLRPIERIPERGIAIIKDMSELSRSEQVEVLSEASRSEDLAFLIVTNTGTFLDSFKRVFNGTEVESDLLNALRAEKPQWLFDKRFYLVNLGRVDSIKTACRILRRMIAESNWIKCLDCKNPDNCPLYINVQLLLEREDIFFERLELLYRRLFEYGTRLTMRHMTGHLAYALTGGLGCYGIRRRSAINREENLSKELFFNRFFGDDGSNELVHAKQLFAIRKIREIGLGTVLDSRFERRTWLQKSTKVDQEQSGIHQRVRSLITTSNSALNRRQMRRYAFFFEPFGDEEEKERFIATFLRSEFLVKYDRYCGLYKELPLRDESYLRRQIIHVLQEFFTGLRFPEGSYKENSIYITLNRESSSTSTQMILADFRVDDFRLVVKPVYQVGDSRNGVLSLKYLRGNGNVELELDLPFLDYVTRRYKGEVAEELSAFYADRLERFKVQLLTLYENEETSYNDTHLKLLVVGNGRRIELKQLLIDDGKLEVL